MPGLVVSEGMSTEGTHGKQEEETPPAHTHTSKTHTHTRGTRTRPVTPAYVPAAQAKHWVLPLYGFAEPSGLQITHVH